MINKKLNKYTYQYYQLKEDIFQLNVIFQLGKLNLNLILNHTIIISFIESLNKELNY